MPSGEYKDKVTQARREAERRSRQRLELATLADPSLERAAHEMLAAKLANRPYTPPKRKRVRDGA